MSRIGIALALIAAFVLVHAKEDSVPKPKMADDDESEESIDAAMEICNVTFTTDMETMNSFMETGSFPDETQRLPKCFMRCILEKIKVMDAEGNFDNTKIISFLTTNVTDSSTLDLYKKTGEKCTKGRNEENKCEKAYQLSKCFMKELP